MTPDERAEVRASLPSEFPVSEAAPPEGEPHFDAVLETRDVLRGFFRRSGRRIYVANDLPVYYPAEPMFSPDVMAVVDVDLHPREHWTVSAEGKALDLTIEILWAGRRAKDLKRNVEKYARLGIREYFIFDRRRLSLSGHRLPAPSARAYQPTLPQGGKYASLVLGLELGIEGERLRFYDAGAALPTSAELLARASAAIDAALSRADDEAKRAEEEARRRADAEREIETLRAELAALRGKRS